MSASRAAYILLGLMTVLCFGGPFLIAVLLWGGERSGWPPDRPIEWIGFGNEKRAGTGFGMGFSVTVEPGDKSPSNHKDEYGWGGAASTHFWVSPRDRLIVVTMEQRWPYSPETEEALKPVIYDAIVK